MAFSYTEHIGDGSTTAFSFGFTGPDKGYIRPSDLVVLVDGVEDPNFSLTSTNTLEMDVAPADGAIVRIRRVMPKGAPYTDFSRGNKFGEANLNNSFLQTLYTVHEFQDGWFPEGFRFLSGVGFASDVDFEGFDIDNVGTLQVDDVIIGAEQLSLADSVAEAYNWAQYPVDALVPEGDGVGEYSSYHYSVKSDDARVLSETARDAAIVARNAAQAAQASAELAEDGAQLYEAGAQSSAAAASASANSAGTYASNASASASAAATSEGNALSYANTAANEATDAFDSAQVSYRWAEYAEDSPVPDGNGTEYSSYHYSRKAAGSATQAASSASASASSASNASTFASDASDSADAAAASALEAEGYATSISPGAFMAVGWYGGSLDDLVTAGTYRIEANPANPTDLWYGNVLVLRNSFFGADTVAQLVFDYESDAFLWRSGNPPQAGGSGSWGPLRRVPTRDLLWQGSAEANQDIVTTFNFQDYDLIEVHGYINSVHEWRGVGYSSRADFTTGTTRAISAMAFSTGYLGIRYEAIDRVEVENTTGQGTGRITAIVGIKW